MLQGVSLDTWGPLKQSVRSLGIQRPLWCRQGGSPKNVCPCSSVWVGCRAFLLFKWWLFGCAGWVFFPHWPVFETTVKCYTRWDIWLQANGKENTSSLLFCSLFPEDNQDSSLQPVEKARRKFPSPRKLGASGGFQPECSAGGRYLQVRTAALLCHLQPPRKGLQVAPVQQRQQLCIS